MSLDSLIISKKLRGESFLPLYFLPATQATFQAQQPKLKIAVTKSYKVFILEVIFFLLKTLADGLLILKLLIRI